MKTVCVVTGTRADYGLLYWPIKALLDLKDIRVSLVATGTHMSEKHGYTVNAIKKDGFQLDAEIDIEIHGDRPGDIVRVMAVALNKFSTYFEKNRPDLLLILGDRYEIFSVAQAAMVHNIPIAHIHGGEITEGAIDDSIRHALTKMSYLHFSSTEEYRKRIIQMGEEPGRVFCTGAPGLDNIKKLTLLSKSEMEKELGCAFNEKNILVTFHPVTISEEQTIKETTNFFSALSKLPANISFYITMPNADTYSENILTIINEFKKQNLNRTHIFTSLGQLKYLSLMKHVDVVAGNSSSGIIEAPFMKKAVLDVGARQKGRITSTHVVHVQGVTQDIYQALVKILSDDFQKKLDSLPSIYGDGEAGPVIAGKIHDALMTGMKTKSFFNL
ncbi:UDP-N-acetylglucosamine 2-epimerase [Bacteriovorax sp. PP10]|uniref:UDP-N-acetylglucosamine 2-epimerase n=1 Tax=Bacteriovorax antarcticus TaxID=3088717 RepID=A0ABU5VVJ4_9BACT|nr:UDP-N-acetylglucosamine 2-epimerase [Bacteriovorax sp. PP10]MEA9356627.1 UDP-N-acetylglucosamine 2-epimerase [Bacteriovorax sp. PP10]